jgi:mono/diheme cytochrome c family protein
LAKPRPSRLDKTAELLGFGVLSLLLACSPSRGEVREWTAEDHDGGRSKGQTPQNTANKDASPGLANTLWTKTCATCHGPRGAGDGPFAPPNIPDLTRPELAERSDDELKQVIREGRNAMPANPDVKDAVLEALIRKIRTNIRPK